MQCQTCREALARYALDNTPGDVVQSVYQFVASLETTAFIANLDVYETIGTLVKEIHEEHLSS